MKQLSIFDFIDEPVVATPTPEPKPKPEPVAEVKPVVSLAPEYVPPPQWQRYDWQLLEYYRELPEVTDPEEIIYVYSICPTHKRQGVVSFSYPVPFGWLNPDEIYCRFPGLPGTSGVFMPRTPLLCYGCLQGITDFLTKLIR